MASTAWRHVVSAVSLAAITTNLLLWTLPLIVTVGVESLCRSRAIRHQCARAVNGIYRAAVRFDSWWLRNVLKVDIRVHGHLGLDRGSKCLLVSNHRSWFDILLIQHLVSLDGPIVQFLIKRELIYVPVVGWICLALRFPRLERGRSEDSRTKDYRSIEAFSESLQDGAGALLNFAEGTRFSREKRERQGSPYQHLLKPRAGGLRIMMDTVGESPVYDLTLVYPDDDFSFWRCLSGALSAVEIHVEPTTTRELGEPGAWLAARWRAKDNLINSSQIRTDSPA